MLIRLLLLLSLPAACIEPYYPPSGAGVGNQMVVNGFIDATAKSATVSLTRAVALGEAVPIPAEGNARVTITKGNGEEYLLEEGKEGVYDVKDLPIDFNATYKLNIVTRDGRSYSSDEVPVLKSPPIDSISWRPQTDGVDFYVSTHDPQGKTRFYRWVFNETWEYNVEIWSDYKKVHNLPVFRNPEDWVYSCWQARNSTNILVNSTKRYTQDLVSLFHVYHVPKGSRKLSHFYRLTVQQRAISEEEFEYWELMKKTTENLGGLFDPLPTQVIGNVHSDDDAGEDVLGYFSAGLTTEKILFVKYLDLPGYLRVIDPWSFQCTSRGVFLNELGTVQPWETYIRTFGTPEIEGYIVALDNCADCRTLGGDNKRPPGWPTK